MEPSPSALHQRAPLPAARTRQFGHVQACSRRILESYHFSRALLPRLPVEGLSLAGGCVCKSTLVRRPTHFQGLCRCYVQPLAHLFLECGVLLPGWQFGASVQAEFYAYGFRGAIVLSANCE